MEKLRALRSNLNGCLAAALVAGALVYLMLSPGTNWARTEGASKRHEADAKAALGWAGFTATVGFLVLYRRPAK